MDLGITGSRAIVLGASRGIGLETAKELRREGVSVAICARDANRLATAHAAIEREGSRGQVYSHPVDLADEEQVREFVRAAIETLGGLDILVHNASSFGGPDVGSWRQSFLVDVLAGVCAVEESVVALEASGKGSVIFIGSGASLYFSSLPGRQATSYGPMKAAMRIYANELGQTLGARGIRVNVVSPGATLAPDGMWERLPEQDPERWKWLTSTFPMGRPVDVAEVARAVVIVASPAGSGINATHLLVDGGQFKGAT